MINNGWISQKQLKLGLYNFHSTVKCTHPSLVFAGQVSSTPDILTGSPNARGRQASNISKKVGPDRVENTDTHDITQTSSKIYKKPFRRIKVDLKFDYVYRVFNFT